MTVWGLELNNFPFGKPYLLNIIESDLPQPPEAFVVRVHHVESNEGAAARVAEWAVLSLKNGSRV
ncbi:hypothetical protein [Candidatus Entotheonella palauensis]|uniref:hypothetical protein n=1 Tax=Candidatus Entotheonella palauensis TaxID=93172 RepID=UPI000B7FC56D|nr:hypothetical protein [Candidatus Entotheonella palauensis]